MDETYDVVVVGAGLAGLAAAATAAGESTGASVLVLDAQAAGRGGRAATDQVGRFRFDRGGHALYRTTVGRDVVARLGVAVKGHLPPLKGAQGRLGDRVGLLPLSAPTLARTPLLGVRDKVAAGKLLAGVGRWRPAELGGMSVNQWFDDLGVDGVLRQLTEMLVRLTSYVCDLDTVSADLVAGQIKAAFEGNVDYLDDGWVSLVDGLVTLALYRGVRIEGGQRVRRVQPDGGRMRVSLDDRTVLAGQVIVAVGTPEACASVLPSRPAEWAVLTPAMRVACLDVGLTTVPEIPILLGIDRPLYFTRHAPPGSLAPPGGSVMQAIRYLRNDEELSPQQARAEMVEHCRVGGFDPDHAEEARYLHRMVLCGGLPTPAAGGMAGRPGIDTGLERILVAGDWVGPVGHLADAALASGESAGRAAAAGIDRDAITRASA